MTTKFQDAAAWLGEQTQRQAGVATTYSRAGAGSASITGTPSQQTYEIQDERGITTEIRAHDWTFVRSDLEISGSAINPRKGDQIAATINGAAVTFKVATLGKMPCYEWLDGSGILVLVHTIVDSE